ncbi:hypothetical protein [Leifsonia sp. NPDC077715]|uniref:hypothetical protein n=1 Tax=Leifsonia sp. NPDC077715 TaxID=3155539 RepID=UPI0034173FA9
MTSVETTLDTDFAILHLQQSMNWVADIGIFALSAPGAVHVVCGTKYARVHVRAERWDARPPFDESWEDFDELPFAEVPGDGPLIIAGFDPGEVRLDVDGIGNARVQVFARGRHRYTYSDGTSGDALQPEEWLFRFFPADDEFQPLAGGPRRLAGEGGLHAAWSDPWSAAGGAVGSSGWDDLLSRSASFRSICQALWSEHGPATADALARRLRTWKQQGESTWADALDDVIVQPLSEADPLAELTGRQAPLTTGRAIDAMRDLGLLLVERRSGQELLIPNPSPEPAWAHQARNGADEATIRRMRVATLIRLHALLAEDLRYAIAWSGEAGVQTTVRSLAIRFAATVAAVTGALRLLVAEGRLVPDVDLGLDAVIDPDVPLRLRCA